MQQERTFKSNAHPERLFCLGSKAQASFWDEHWKEQGEEDFKKRIQVKDYALITRTTARYLPKGARILEGGCGQGSGVYALHHRGYTVSGVDYAKQTVEQIKLLCPELDIQVADVRELPFADSSFDAYWSLGVIEHFYHGYEKLQHEMLRVLKQGGFLFLTVPAKSPLRKLKAKLKIYPALPKNKNYVEEHFYQYLLSPDFIIKDFEKAGFERVAFYPWDGLKGLKDESCYPLSNLLSLLYRSKGLWSDVLRAGLDRLCRPFSYHMGLYVFRKK